MTITWLSGVACWCPVRSRSHITTLSATRGCLKATSRLRFRLTPLFTIALICTAFLFQSDKVDVDVNPRSAAISFNLSPLSILSKVANFTDSGLSTCIRLIAGIFKYKFKYRMNLVNFVTALYTGWNASKQENINENNLDIFEIGISNVLFRSKLIEHEIMRT